MLEAGGRNAQLVYVGGRQVVVESRTLKIGGRGVVLVEGGSQYVEVQMVLLMLGSWRSGCSAGGGSWSTCGG